MSTERMTLAATRRTETGKGPNRRLRAAGRLPATVYGDTDETISVSVDPKEFTEVLLTPWGFNNVFRLSVDGGEPLTVMVKDRQFDSVKRVITHVDFFVVNDDRMVSILVPVETLGNSVGVKAGGRLQVVAREIRLRCAVRNVPASVPHDVTTMAISDQVYIDEMAAPEGCEFVFRHRFPVIRIARKRGLKVEDDEGAEVAAPEEAVA